MIDFILKVVFGVILSLILAFPVMWFFNDLAFFKPITYWQAFELFILCEILFKPFSK